jgi:hypothetical protein
VSLEFWLQLCANLIAIGVAYGSLASKVASFEKQNDQMREDFSKRLGELRNEHGDEILRIRGRLHQIEPTAEVVDRFLKAIGELKK